jgi:hypothetical protein
MEDQMSENFEEGLAGEIDPEVPAEIVPEVTPDDVFAELDGMVRQSIPEGATITFRVETGVPLYVPLVDQETGITINAALTRRGLTVSPTTMAYVESQPVPFETYVPANTVVTLIGQVKGG